MKSILSGVKKVKPHAYRKLLFFPKAKENFSEKLFFSVFVLLMRGNHYIIKMARESTKTLHQRTCFSNPWRIQK